MQTFKLSARPVAVGTLVTVDQSSPALIRYFRVTQVLSTGDVWGKLLIGLDSRGRNIWERNESYIGYDAGDGLMLCVREVPRG